MPPLALQLQSANKQRAKFCLGDTYAASLPLPLMRAQCLRLRAEFDPSPPPRMVRGSDASPSSYFALQMDEWSAPAQTIAVQTLNITAMLISRSISSTTEKKINVWQDKICRGKENIILRLHGGYYYKQWRIDKLYLTLLKAVDSVPLSEHTEVPNTVWLQPARPLLACSPSGHVENNPPSICGRAAGKCDTHTHTY